MVSLVHPTSLAVWASTIHNSQFTITTNSPLACTTTAPHPTPPLGGASPREVLEETGIQLRAPVLAYTTNSVFHDIGKHYVTVYMREDVDEVRACRAA